MIGMCPREHGKACDAGKMKCTECGRYAHVCDVRYWYEYGYTITECPGCRG